MRLLVCAGMTGGGVYPALAVLQAMKNKIDDVLWIGSKGSMESALLKSYNLRYESVSAAGLHGVSLRSLPGNAIQLFKGTREAKAIITEFNPDVMFFTGGFLGVPVAYAGRYIPSVVFVPDIEPGLALKTIIRYAENVAISVPDSKVFIRHAKTHVTGYPVRKEMASWTRAKGRKFFNIEEKYKVLLVFGGSKGAKSINHALSENLGKILSMMQVIHITGKDNWEETEAVIKKLDKKEKARYHAYPYLHKEMGAAFAAADLAVCRAGASTLGELPIFGLPAILVPYPHAWRYQHLNAEHLQEHGGALLLEDKDLPTKLLSIISEIMNDENRLLRMRKAMKVQSRPDAADQIADLILQTGKTSRHKEASNG